MSGDEDIPPLPARPDAAQPAARIGVDDWVARFPRASGAIILVLSLIPAIASGFLIFSLR